jgi:uridine monophosphate synthetase
MLESAGLIVNQAVVLLDREQGGREMLESKGYTLSRAMTLGQALAVYETERRISSEQRANVLKSLT